MIDRQSVFGTPAYPLEEVVDPTGAGDAFAGGFVGYLAAANSCAPDDLRKAVVFGSVMASFNVSEFGPKRLAGLTFPEIEARYREFRALTNFGDI
jgi:sugar/nucleoside kinase (ribokinase family)